MKQYEVLITATGQMQSLSRGKLSALLKKYRREAAQMLKSSGAKHVVYGLQHDSAHIHIMPCAVYTDARYKASFTGRHVTIKPLAVHRR